MACPLDHEMESQMLANAVHGINRLHVHEHHHSLDQGLMAASNSSWGLDKQQQTQTNMVVLHYKYKLALAEAEIVRLGEENGQMRAQVACTVAERDKAVMSLELQATQAGSSCVRCQRATERIGILEKQIWVCAEQLESEGYRRQGAQSIVAELENELWAVRRQLVQFQGHQKDEIAERRRAALEYHRMEYERQHPPVQSGSFWPIGQPPSTQSHTPDCDADDEGGKGLNTVDCGPNFAEQINGTDSTCQHFTEADDPLHCPTCRIGFPVSEHEKLIAHANVCI